MISVQLTTERPSPTGCAGVREPRRAAADLPRLLARGDWGVGAVRVMFMSVTRRRLCSGRIVAARNRRGRARSAGQLTPTTSPARRLNSSPAALTPRRSTGNVGCRGSNRPAILSGIGTRSCRSWPRDCARSRLRAPTRRCPAACWQGWPNPAVALAGLIWCWANGGSDRRWRLSHATSSCPAGKRSASTPPAAASGSRSPSVSGMADSAMAAPMPVM